MMPAAFEYLLVKGYNSHARLPLALAQSLLTAKFKSLASLNLLVV